MERFTLAELAETTGVPARTVRFYQASGLLPRARRVGRFVEYDEGHVQRLQQIVELQGNGLKLSTIRDMLDTGGVGTSPVVALMGAGMTGERWLTDSERTFSVTELATFLGHGFFELVDSLESAGYLERRSADEGTHWFCSDLPLLRGALRLAETGTSIELSARARDMLRRRVRRLAEDLVEMWEADSGSLFGDGEEPEPARHLAQVRAVAWQSAAYVMAKEIDRAVHARA